MSDATCSIDGCATRAVSRGWCSAHYERWRRHGDPEAGGDMARRRGQLDPAVVARLELAAEQEAAARARLEDLIVEARAGGGSLRAIAAISGRSHSEVDRIVKRAGS